MKNVFAQVNHTRIRGGYVYHTDLEDWVVSVNLGRIGLCLMLYPWFEWFDEISWWLSGFNTLFDDNPPFCVWLFLCRMKTKTCPIWCRVPLIPLWTCPICRSSSFWRVRSVSTRVRFPRGDGRCPVAVRFPCYPSHFFSLSSCSVFCHYPTDIEFFMSGVIHIQHIKVIERIA